MWQTIKNHKIDLFSPQYLIFQRNRIFCGQFGPPKLQRTPKGLRFLPDDMHDVSRPKQGPHNVCIFDALDKLEQGVTHRCKTEPSNCKRRSLWHLGMVWCCILKDVSKSPSLEKQAHGSGNFDLFTGKSSKQHAWGSGVPLMVEVDLALCYSRSFEVFGKIVYPLVN